MRRTFVLLAEVRVETVSTATHGGFGRFKDMPSSVIRRVAYDEASRRLTIGFVGGRVYAYADVPPDIADGLAAAASRGGFFNAEVRDRFAAVRLRQRRLG